jgi:hypothetical protein
MKMEQTECSETSAYIIQTLGNYPGESIQHSLNHFKLSSVHCDYKHCDCNHPYTLKNAQNLYHILKIIHTRELSYMFQQKITILGYNSKAYTSNTSKSHVQFY